MTKELYKPFYNQQITPNNKKYSVYVKGKNGPKLIHFGAIGYEQYYDKGRRYKIYDHLDKIRRANYRARAKKIKDKAGNYTYNNKNTANYWAYNFLW